MSDFRYPFFAYASTAAKVIISPLAHSKHYVHFDLEQETGEENIKILQIAFSNLGNLIILAQVGNILHYYRLKVKNQLAKDKCDKIAAIDTMSLVSLTHITGNDDPSYTYHEEVCTTE